MTLTETKTKTPGIVILTAIFNFILGSFFVLSTFIFVIASLVMSQWWIWSSRQMVAGPRPEWVTDLSAYGPGFALTLLLAVFFALALSAALLIWTGIGLLQRKRFAWYAQIVQSVFGLFFFPLGTLIHLIALILFFRPAVREHFGV